jgi:hypothetical protein
VKVVSYETAWTDHILPKKASQAYVSANDLPDDVRAELGPDIGRLFYWLVKNGYLAELHSNVREQIRSTVRPESWVTRYKFAEGGDLVSNTIVKLGSEGNRAVSVADLAAGLGDFPDNARMHINISAEDLECGIKLQYDPAANHLDLYFESD